MEVWGAVSMFASPAKAFAPASCKHVHCVPDVLPTHTLSYRKMLREICLLYFVTPYNIHAGIPNGKINNLFYSSSPTV